MDGIMVVNGVRAAYTMTRTRDGKGFSASVRYKPQGTWEPVGPPGAVFADATEARAAIRSQITANVARVLGLV